MGENWLSLLIVDDEPNIRSGLSKGLQGEVSLIEVAEDGEQGWDKFLQDHHEIVITDLRLPGTIDGLELVKRIHDHHPETHVIVITAHGTVETAVDAMRHGAFDFVSKPVDLNVIRHQVRKAAEHHQLVDENRQLREHLAEAGEVPEFVGNSPATQEVLRQVRQIANTDATVLILGESGTGKELTARAIHQLSERRKKPMVTFNIGALPDTLMESELFGHERGAFTDARRQKIGQFEAAEGGTIFLDEVTETSPKSQVDLLRVLEERELRRLGGDEVIPIDVRVVSATNKDLDALVSNGGFREDLYYRLNVVPIRIPPLRERRDDIPLLVNHFLTQFCSRHRRECKRVAPKAMQALITQNWPGNIRQLRNFVERLVVTVNSDVIHDDDLPDETRDVPSGTVGTLSTAVEDAEKQAILGALAACDYHRERTAGLLDISVRTLHYKMNRYALH